MNRRLTNQIFGGLILIGLGGLFLLRQLGYLDFSIRSLISSLWPMILILIGIRQFIPDHPRESPSFIGGTIFLGLGLFFLGRNFDVIDISAAGFIKLFVPGMLILGGLYVIFRPRRPEPPRPLTPPAPPAPPEYYGTGRPLDAEPPKPLESSLDEQFERKFGKAAGGQASFEEERPQHGGRTDWERYLHKDEPGDSFGREAEYGRDGRHEHKRRHRAERRARRGWENWEHEYDDAHHGGCNTKDSTNKSAFIGDIHMGQEYFQLKHTNVSQFIGDTVLDLTNAQIPYGETKINLSAFIGDIKVYVPDDMDLGISVNGSSFIGDMAVLNESRSGFMSNVKMRTPYYKEANKRIKINVSSFIGDIKVKTVG